MAAKEAVAILNGGDRRTQRGAHELAERGSAVTEFKRNAVFGGKARSVSVAGSDGRMRPPVATGLDTIPHIKKRPRLVRGAACEG